MRPFLPVFGHDAVDAVVTKLHDELVLEEKPATLAAARIARFIWHRDQLSEQIYIS
jgi:hypothetical protein